ncbi:hypothetical protein BSKO_07311 [Bryopsis sp. KO-2023]|nr:hypothetical protein BSKO_07311 [Bryopsis sp. KO-2023]
MGCCQSRADEFEVPVKRLPSLENVKAHHRGQGLPGVQVHTFRAGWQATSSFGDHSCVQMDTGAVFFAALFDPHNSKEAAAFCTKHCWEVFSKCLSKSKQQCPADALMAMFSELDRMFLQSDAPPMARATSGCSGVAVCIDFSARKYYVANVGTSQCILGSATGSFNSKAFDGKLLTDEHSARCVEEQARLRKTFPNDSTIVTFSDGKPMVKGVAKVTRCLGYGFAKDKHLAGVYNKSGAKRLDPLPSAANPYITAEAEVREYDLCSQAEHLMLCSEGILNVLSPLDAALFCSQFSHQNLMALYRSFLRPSNDGVVPAADEARCSPAAALVRQTMSRTAENWTRTLSRDKVFDLDDLRKLEVENHAAPGVVLRRDVHENVNAIVISLDWARSLTAHQLQNVLPKPGLNPQNSTYRWHLVALLSRYLIARRRSILRQWWDAVDMAVEQARSEARNAEVAAWMSDCEVLHLTASTGLKESKIPQKRGQLLDSSSSLRSSSSASAIPPAPKLLVTAIPVPSVSPTGSPYCSWTAADDFLLKAAAHPSNIPKIPSRGPGRQSPSRIPSMNTGVRV